MGRHASGKQKEPAETRWGLCYQESSIIKRTIHILGLQKSGTSLLVRLIENTGLAQFLDGKGRTEGGIAWGQKPSFSPTAFPVGTIYQRSGGQNGHQIGAEDATTEVCNYIRENLVPKTAALPAPLGLSKCPYSTVRIPWIRAVLPDLFIVGIVRKPVPNVFSLLKRFRPSPGNREPEDGWWGVKPRKWKGMVSQDKVTQVAHQWRAVNAKMWEDRELLDMIVTYDDLCDSPSTFVGRIVEGASDRDIVAELGLPFLRSCDDEYLRGSRLMPKRAYWADSNELSLPESEEIEMEPLGDRQIESIETICGETARKFWVETR